MSGDRTTNTDPNPNNRKFNSGVQRGKDLIRSEVQAHANDPNWLEQRWVRLDQARRKINRDMGKSDACFKGKHDHCHNNLSPCDCYCHQS